MLAEAAFVACSVVLLLAGARLVVYGEAIAEKTRLSVAWIGAFLVASVTSLPELFTGLSSIVVVGEPDLAAGDVLGSCLFNLAVAAVAALATRRLVTADADHVSYRLATTYLLVMLAVIGAAISMRASLRPGALGVAAALPIVIYLVAIRHLFHAQARQATSATSARFAQVGRRRVFALYGFHSVIVALAAGSLPFLARSIAVDRGLDAAFVGTALLAASTSMPEMVVSFAAVRRGLPNLAIAGLLGSNLFDIVILAIDDLAYAQGPLLAAISPFHLVTISAIAAMSGLLLLGMPARRRPRVAPLLMVLAFYVVALAAAATGIGQA